MADGRWIDGNGNKSTWRLQHGNNFSQKSRPALVGAGGNGRERNAPKTCWSTVKGPIVTVSRKMTPAAEPDPYLKEIRSVPVWRDVDFDVSNSGVPDGQEAQRVVANHKSDEPVSRTRLKDWALGTRGS